MRCHEPSKVNEHLDKLLEIRDSLEAWKITIPEEMFNNTIIASIPNIFKPTINALVVVAARTSVPLTTRELVSTIRAEASGHTRGQSGKKESANYAGGNSNRGRGGFNQNRGNFRGQSRGRGNGNRGGGQSRPNSNNSTCYNCGGKGHFANKCSSPKRQQANEAQESSQKKEKNQPSGSGSNNWRSKNKEVGSSATIEEVPESSWAAMEVTTTTSQEIFNFSEIASNYETAFVASHSSGAILFDSGCSSHMTPLQDKLRNTRSVPTRIIQAANAETFTSNTAGNLQIDLPINEDGISKSLTLQNTLLCPNTPDTLVSLGKLDDAGYVMVIKDGTLKIINRQGETIGIVPKTNGLYQIPSAEYAYAGKATRMVSLYEAHCIAGHQNYAYVKHMFKSNQVHGIKLDPKQMEEPECRTCMLAKAARFPISKIRTSQRVEKFGDVFHMDVWGPASVQTLNHYVYALTVIDEATSWLEEPLMKGKDEAFAQYVILQTGLQTQYGVTVKKLHSDQGGEFLSGEFTAYLERLGTKRSLTVHDTPEHNGIAEHSHRTLLNGVRSLMISSGLPKWLWGFMMGYTVYVWNRTPKKANGMISPWEKQFGTIPDISNFHIFGSTVYVKREKEPGKLDPQAQGGRWVGIEPESNGYFIYWPDRHTERNVQFSDRQIQPVEGEDQDLGNLETSVTELEQPIIPVPEEIAEPINPDIITGKRVRKPTKKIQDIINGLGEPNQELRHLTASLGQVTGEIIADPTSVAEAMRCPDWSQWREAMNEEIRRLQQRRTYDIVIPPDDANILTSKWVFRTKRDEQGKVTGHRARLVVRGFNQIPDVDYFPDETFASVTKLAAARAILSTGAEQNMFIHQMDVKSAYLYGKLDDNEQIYMKAPPGVDIEVKAGQVLKLKLALYGLKQAGRRWYMRFREIMTSVGLTRSNFDHAVFY
ncbi:hypothetical protein HHX47_DHR2000553 [Lentinula edodes]|nr:hypothetical protein HHX47_DHR2000553 [Lentinula edodes]